MENPNDSNTHHWFALFLAAQGNFPRARQELEKARQLDPLSLIVQTNLGWLSYFQRDFPGAERQFQDVLQIDPVFPPAHTKLWLSYVRSGNDGKAIQELTNALRLAGAPELSDRIGQRYRTSGLKPALSEFIGEGAPRGFFGEFQKAMLLALDGDKAAAIDSLNRAANQRDGWMVYIRIEPALDSLRSDPRFQALLSRLNDAD
jgi:tetratricopeptide (TPR) repeat protein